MILKVSDSTEETAEMTWRLRDLLALFGRRLRLRAALRSYDALSDAQLEDIGLTRGDLEIAARNRRKLPRRLSDAYVRRQPFAGLVRRRAG